MESLYGLTCYLMIETINQLIEKIKLGNSWVKIELKIIQIEETQIKEYKYYMFLYFSDVSFKSFHICVSFVKKLISDKGKGDFKGGKIEYSQLIEVKR